MSTTQEPEGAPWADGPDHASQGEVPLPEPHSTGGPDAGAGTDAAPPPEEVPPSPS